MSHFQLLVAIHQKSEKADRGQQAQGCFPSNTWIAVGNSFLFVYNPFPDH